MTMTDWENTEEARYLELYEEHREEAIKEFRAERSRAYFILMPDVAKAPMAFFRQAERLLPESSEGALVLCAAASEATLKTLLFRPLVSGLVHQESFATLLADEVCKQFGLDRVKDLLFALLKHVGEIDLATYKRDQASRTLWEELKSSSEKRNRVVHRCETAKQDEAELAILIAKELLLHIYPEILDKLGLHLHGDVRVCAEPHLSLNFPHPTEHT